jgi:hypothetical protein
VRRKFRRVLIFGIEGTLYHFEHCILNRKHENEGMLVQVVRFLMDQGFKQRIIS